MNALELEYKQSTGEYPKNKAYGHLTKSEGIFISHFEAGGYSHEMDEYGFIAVPSKEYVEWLEEELFIARKLLTT